MRRAAIWAALLAAVTGGGAYAWAWVSNVDRIAAFTNDVPQLDFARGGRVPTEAEFRTQLEALAVTHNVILTEISIRQVESSDVDAVGRIANERTGAGLAMRRREFQVRASVEATTLGFSRSETVEATRSYRLQVTLPRPTPRPLPNVTMDSPMRGL